MTKKEAKYPPQSVAFVMLPELRFFLLAVARRLKDETSAAIHAYVSTQQEVDFYRPFVDNGLFSSVSNSELGLRSDAAHHIDDSFIAEARLWEEKLGCTFSYLAVSNRHFGRGYALAGSGHPRSTMSESFNLDDMTRAYIWQCRFWEEEFNNRRFDLVINGVPLLARMARRHKVNYRTILASRTDNYHYWAIDEYYTNPQVEAAFNRLRLDTHSAADISQPYLVERSMRKQFGKGDSFISLSVRIVKMIATRAYHHLRGYEKARGYYLIENIKYVTRVWWDTKTMTSRNVVRLDALKDRPFVFFPLHTEPETSVGQISPEFFFQHAAIAALSRDLPSGVILAVKETIYGVGRRPPGFYRQIADLKNVVWLDMMEYGLEVSRHALAVATIAGTAGMEAAVMGKPVIAFGHHNIYNFLPHVFAPANVADLSGPLRAIADGEVDLQQSAIDGARYLKAVQSTSFDMRGFDYINREAFEPECVVDAVDSLLRSLTVVMDAGD